MCRIHTGTGSTLSVGPSFQFYHMNTGDNAGRFIAHTSLINAYGSATVNKHKVHLGLAITFINNKGNNNILPYKGYYLEIGLQRYEGINPESRAYAQIRPEFTYYQSLDNKGNIVLSGRIDGGISTGSPAFYQSMFLAVKATCWVT